MMGGYGNFRRRAYASAISRRNRHKLREVRMNESEKTKGLTSPCEPKPRPRKPYHKPEVRYERVFEVQALVCGKVQTTQFGCHYNRRNS
jgi:hypothetical protein